MSECDVLVCQPIPLDYTFYRHWLKGLSVREVVTAVQYSEFSVNCGPETLYNYIRHQYRYFELVDHFLKLPTGEGKVDLFAEQFLFPLPSHVRQALIDGYYELDEALVKGVLGKKLTSAMRKNLDEVSEDIGLSLHSCRRQFDNLKRVFKVVEDLEGGIIERIQENFLISQPLAKQYTRILFMTKNKLETYSNKKKLSTVTFADFDYCVSMFLRYWTVKSSSLDLDPKFLRDIAELKNILLGDTFDELRSLISTHFTNAQMENTLTKVKGHTKTIVRNIITIGAGLRQEKEFRDIFLDIVEKIIEPCKKVRLSAEECGELIISISIAFRNLKTLPDSEKLAYDPSLHRFTLALKQCVERLYSNT